MNIEKKFLHTVKKFDLLSKGDRVLVAFSGGPDSVLLSHLLIKFKNHFKLAEVAVAHLNHMLRQEAEEDEKFAASFAATYGIRVFTRKVDIKSVSKLCKKSVEEAGREERYRFLREVALEEGYTRIATAHHLSDLAETMTIWFLQGGKRGLRGFRPKAGDLIRPLYYLTKQEILDYCHATGLEYRVDSSNLSEKYLRNRVRLKVIPVLKQINSSVETSLERMSYFIDLDEEYFDKKLNQLHLDLCKDYLSLDDLRGLEDAILYRVFQRWFENAGLVVSYQQLRKVMEFYHNPAGKKFISLGKGRKLYVAVDRFKLVENLENGEFLYKLKLGQKIYIREAGLWIEAFKPQMVDVQALKVDRNIECFELEGDEFVVRSRREGDRMVPFGHSSEKKLKDIFIDMKIPKHRRNSIPLLVFGDKILWVCGYRRSALYPVREDSKNVICFKLTKEV